MRSLLRSAASCGTSFVLLGGLGGCREDAADPTGPAAEPGPPAAAAVAPLAFRQVSAGRDHTCGVTTVDQAYCWGDNGSGGQLGDGTTMDRLKPVRVAGGLTFRQVSAGSRHSCGVTTTNLAYCWGLNEFGQLGDGTTEHRTTPVPVAGGRRFRQISAGAFHTCAVTTTDALFCWGTNLFGAMGAPNSHTPVRVGGTLKFRNVSSGYSHSCGAATDNRGYCWGNNSNYQIGDGTGTGRAKPTLVAGGLSFRLVQAGSGYISGSGPADADDALSCGLTTDDRVYCWGSHGGSSTPKEIAGGRRYSAIGTGTAQCALNLAGAIFCALGQSRIPSGTVRFRSVSVSGIGSHRCAVATDGRAYCWGGNDEGQLGDGTTNPSTALVAVAAPE